MGTLGWWGWWGWRSHDTDAGFRCHRVGGAATDADPDVVFRMPGGSVSIHFEHLVLCPRPRGNRIVADGEPARSAATR